MTASPAMKPTTRGDSVRLRSLVAVFAVGALGLGAAACGSSNESSSGGGNGGNISGAGSTFAAPLYDELGNRVKGADGITVNYNPIGSGGGIAQFTAGTVDFGATDAAMKPEEIKAAEAKGAPVHIPAAFGAVTVAYNVSGVDKGLKLDGTTVADIFLGNIEKWNDPAIAKLNPGAKLPDTAITVAHRSDESGTTKLFTEFLSDSNPTWKSKVGSDKTVKWPTGTGAKGNDGVAGAIKQTQGAIGYVELAYALQNNFSTADVKNSSGNFVAPTLQSTSAAGEGLKIPADLRFSAINSPNPQAYPIASATFMLVYEDMCKAGLSKDKAANVFKWANYVVGGGQKVAPDLQYAPLPTALDQKAQAKVDGLTCNGSPLKA
jgi:phosphate transport system substrate-binding protein